MDALRYFKNGKWVPLYAKELTSFLSKEGNLSDIANPAEAVENLGLTGEIETHTHDQRYALITRTVSEIARLDKRIDDLAISNQQEHEELRRLIGTKISRDEFNELKESLTKKINDSINNLTRQISELDTIPIGTVIIWPLNSTPGIDYLECNGQEVNGGAYPRLRALMAHTPDYRGVFLRGLGSVSSSHYGSVVHSSSGLGNLQGDSIRNITGWFGISSRSQAGGVFRHYNDNHDIEGISTGNSSTNGTNFDAARVIPVSNEIRPINKAVRYFIKAK